MMSYHELTAGGAPPTNQRSQFLVASAIITILLVHSSLSAGLLATLSIIETKDTVFPGGTFIYKSMQKDYAASFGTLRTIASDLTEGGIRTEDDDDDLLYTIYMDDEALIPGGKTRFASGVLLTSSSSSKQRGYRNVIKVKKWLLEAINSGIDMKLIQKNIAEEDARHSKDVRYQISQLPRVSAAVAYHPFNDGVWSAVLQSFKIIPKFKKYYAEHGKEREKNSSPIIIANCSIKQGMCTYYMPLTKRDKFFLGKKTTEEYANEFNNMAVLERMGINLDLRKLFRWSNEL